MKSLEISLVRWPLLVLTTADRTWPSFPLWTRTTRPKRHWPQGIFSSMIKTKSSSFRSRQKENHLWHFCNVRRYSRSQRLQKTSARYWTCLQRRWLSGSCLEKERGGIAWFDFSISKWWGVKGSASVGSSGFCVKGREFKIDCALATTASSSFKMTCWFERTNERVFNIAL